MSGLLKNLTPGQLFHAHKVLSSIQVYRVRKCHWFPDYKPGQYPTTKEERERAAKKYNLLPEEYEPYPLNEDSCGDYPNIPKRSEDDRDPYYPWDDEDLKRDYNQAIAFEEMHLCPVGISTGKKGDYWPGARQHLIFLAVGTSILYFLTCFKQINPLAEKQYVTPGVTHYTFDLEQDHH